MQTNKKLRTYKGRKKEALHRSKKGVTLARESASFGLKFFILVILLHVKLITIYSCTQIKNYTRTKVERRRRDVEATSV